MPTQKKSEEWPKLRRTKDYSDSAHKHSYGTTVDGYLNDEQYQRRMHQQGNTQTDMEEFDRTALERKNHAATCGERRYHRDLYTVVQPNLRTP